MLKRRLYTFVLLGNVHLGFKLRYIGILAFIFFQFQVANAQVPLDGGFGIPFTINGQVFYCGQTKNVLDVVFQEDGRFRSVNKIKRKAKLRLEKTKSKKERKNLRRVLRGIAIVLKQCKELKKSNGDPNIGVYLDEGGTDDGNFTARHLTLLPNKKYYRGLPDTPGNLAQFDCESSVENPAYNCGSYDILDGKLILTSLDGRKEENLLGYNKAGTIEYIFQPLERYTYHPTISLAGISGLYSSEFVSKFGNRVTTIELVPDPTNPLRGSYHWVTSTESYWDYRPAAGPPTSPFNFGADGSRGSYHISGQTISFTQNDGAKSPPLWGLYVDYNGDRLPPSSDSGFQTIIVDRRNYL